MPSRNNTLMLMSKLPEPGWVKTRLTLGRGGQLPPEAAAILYHSMLLDVVETAMAALDELDTAETKQQAPARDSYDLVVATSDAASVTPLRELIEKAGPWPRDFEVIALTGAAFGEALDSGIEQCFARGADCVLALYGDCPTLTAADVRRAFQELHALEEWEGRGIAIAPNHKNGISIVGVTREARLSHEDIFSNPQPCRALSSYIAKAAELGLPARCLPAVPDVDTMDDLVHVAALVQALNYCAASAGPAHPPWRTAAALYKLGFRDAVVRKKT